MTNKHLINKKLLSVTELAKYLGVKKSTIYSWVHQKRIPFIKICRLVKFDICSINAWIKQHTVCENNTMDTKGFLHP